MSDTPRTDAAIEAALAEPGMAASFEAAAEIARELERNNNELVTGLKEVLSMLESGELVRDISKDAQVGWTVKMMHFVGMMTRWQLAIARAEAKPKLLSEAAELENAK